ncbi:MAG: hypothetical protein ACREEE_17125 [Dongiaceae bacterium]
MAEVATYLCVCIRRCGYQAERTINQVTSQHHNIIVCGHLLKEGHLAHLPRNTVLFNSEQLEDKLGWHLSSGTYRRIIDSHFVWDYSAHNLATISHEWKVAIPFHYCAALRRTNLKRTCGETLLFYGALSKRRRSIVAELRDAGVKVRVLFDVYGNARDAEMFNSWAVLNLHKSDSTNVFEPVRCFYPLINRIPVISESFRREPLTAVFEQSLFVAGTETLIEDIVALYEDRESLEDKAIPLMESFARTDPIPYFEEALARYFAFLEVDSTAGLAK